MYSSGLCRCNLGVRCQGSLPRGSKSILRTEGWAWVSQVNWGCWAEWGWERYSRQKMLSFFFFAEKRNCSLVGYVLLQAPTCYSVEQKYENCPFCWLQGLWGYFSLKDPYCFPSQFHVHVDRSLKKKRHAEKRNEKTKRNDIFNSGVREYWFHE